MTVQHSLILGHQRFLIPVERDTGNHVFACGSIFQVDQRVRGLLMLGSEVSLTKRAYDVNT